MRLATLIIACFALTGCTASSVNELKQSAARKQEYTVAANYQEVYRNIAACARAGWGSVGYLLSPQASNIVDADLYSDLGTGEITMRMSNLGNHVYAHALIERQAPTQTKLTVWNYLSSWDHIGPAMKSWAEGERCN